MGAVERVGVAVCGCAAVENPKRREPASEQKITRFVTHHRYGSRPEKKASLAVRLVRDLERIRLDYQIQPMEDRCMKTLVFLVCSFVMGMSAIPNLSAETEPADAERYGPYPTNYKEIVMKWLDTQLIDSTSARIEWSGDPKPADLGTKGEHLYGYLVNFKVNARNRFGAYTGMQSHGALIRDGEVIKGLGFGY